MTLENFNYRTNPMFLRNQFPSDNIYGIPSLPKAALTGEEQEKLMLIAFNSLKATPHKERLTAQHRICLLFFRHSAQNSLDNRQVNYARFAQSDEKIDGASAALSLCGIALKNSGGKLL